MNIKNIIVKFPLVLFFITILFISCTDKTLNQDIIDTGLKGTLTGKISIGPLCPVETIPPSPNCQPTEETYKAWAIAVWSKNKKSKIQVIRPILDGTFSIELPANNYVIDFDSKHSFAVGGSNLPVSLTVEPNDTVEINIDIDTGIR